MKQTFLQALDPTSKKSGLTYNHLTDDSFFNSPKNELTVLENISAYDDDLDLWEDICMPFHILVGSHYSASPYYEKYGAKGILDYLFFPLLARKLIYDTYLEERKDCHITNALAWLVAVPLELVRLGTGLALSLLLAPIMAIAHFAHACLSMQNLEEEYLLQDEMTTVSNL